MYIPKIILASSSPRRRKMLELLGLNFKVHPSNFDESSFLHLSPKELAIESAKQKAIEITEFYPNSIVIGADTVVSLGPRIFGKPTSPEEARETLLFLKGKTHLVTSGIAIVSKTQTKQHILADTVETFVTMRNFSDKEIEDYINTGEPLDKAGAYGIQGRGKNLIEKIDGCYFNVIGLPLPRLLEMLNQYFDTTHYLSIIPEIKKHFNPDLSF